MIYRNWSNSCLYSYNSCQFINENHQNLNREFFLNIAFLVLINLLIKPLYIFGIDRSVQNLVGEATYGVYFSLMSFTVLFQILNDFGIQNFNSREIAQHPQLLDKYFSNIMAFKALLGVFYFGLIFISAYFLKYDKAVYPMLFSLSLNTLLLSMLGYLRTNVAGLGQYRLNSLLTILDRFLLIIVCSFLLWVEPFKAYFNINTFINAQNTTLFVTVFIAFWATFRQVKIFTFRFNFPFWLSILRGSLPYALAIFLMTIYTRTDVVMLERMLPDGDRQAGIYASAYRLLDAVNVLGFLFAGLLLPMFSRLLKEKMIVTPLLRFSFQLIVVASVTLAAAVWFHRVDIMQLLYRQATAYSGDVLGFLMLSFIAVSGVYIYSTLLGANGDVSSMNLTFILAFIINIGLNFWLIPNMKALGASISTCITQFFVLVCVILLAKKRLSLRGDWLWSLKIGSFVGGSFLIHFLIKSYSNPSYWLIQIAIGMTLTLGLALILGFLNYKKVGHLLTHN
jgi:O-antigen/teichoic acid export membrane protein